LSDKKIRIAIAGVGNCASALIQGICYYKDKQDLEASGIMHEEIGGYKPWDIEIVAAWDIDARKVGFDVSQQFLHNQTVLQFLKEIFPHMGVKSEWVKSLTAIQSI
jgi:Myo-inositol-1-phosphate synthase